ncbi:MAG: murein L,D-transpeptidase catalytic domain family protein [Chitinophagaceae bacterium]
MKNTIQGLSVFLACLLLSVFCLSFGYSHSSSREVISKLTGSHPSVIVPASSGRSLYDSLHLQSSGLSREAYGYLIKGVEELRASGQLTNDSIVTICDFSKPSSEKRLYILNLHNYRVLFNTWVAHGRNSGKELAASFSNTMSSNKSSLGFYRTGDTYMGGHGLSLRLHGLEKGINDKAMERAIVLHGADYVSPTFLKVNGFMGRSFGCPAVSNREVKPIINTIKGGTCLFIYSPDRNYLSRSALIGGDA